MSDFRNNLKYPITIEGIEVTDSQALAEDRPEIVITRSLDSNLLSECLSNTYLCSILLITLLRAFQIMTSATIFKLSAKAQYN